MKRFLPICCLLLALILSGCSHESEVQFNTITTTASVTLADSTGTKADPTMPSTAGAESTSPVTTAPVTTESAGTASTSASAETTPVKSTETAPATSAETIPATSAKTTPATSAKTTPETSKTPPVTSSETTPATSDGTTSAPPVTNTPNTNTDPADGIYLEKSAIVFAKRALTLYQDGETVLVEADTALLCTGVGEGYTRVLWLGKTAYVRTEDTTEERPRSALELAAEKGGIYYKGTGPLIAIDAGHQDHSMKDKEPLGPGSSEMKAKLSSGTQGVATRLEEYKLNLAVALLLRDELIGRGYSVVMIRETNNVEMSNAERALIANGYNADAFIRIHANGSEDKSVTGAYTLCPTAKNPYNSDIYPECKRLSETILDQYIESTGFKKKSIWYTDTMTGLNWASVPVTLIEMGYMSNADEDRTMATAEFQRKAAIGMANGFDVYFGRG